MQYKHLTIEEREKIQELLWQQSSICSIAMALSRSPSSISREINKNLDSIGRRRYLPRAAHERALIKRKSRGRTERLKNEQIRDYVVKKLKRRWSPEQISGRMKKDIGEHVSHEAIYQYIYAQIHRNGCGELKPGREDLRLCLRYKRKRRMPKGTRRCQRIFKPNGISIDMRPVIVNRRSRLGDWESDTVESINRKPGINTLVERKSGLVLITKLESKNSHATISAIGNRLSPLPQKVKQTITFDNGPENRDWKELERQTKMKAFFAHAYHSWERGVNENANGLIRDYFPKKTDFTTIPNEKLSFVERELNNRPRKRLGWKTPLEIFSVALRG